MDDQIKNYQAALVDDLKKNGFLHNPEIEQAFLRVPRHLFLPGEPLDQVYSDRVIAVKRDEEGNWTSSSSQPAIMARMLEQLDLHPGLRVLEIGAGSGFNAALIAEIVGKEGSVVSIDIQPDIIDQARGHLRTAGYGRVLAVVGDGGLGFSPGAPYDRIILTASSSMIAPAWREQLAEGGILVLPLDIGAGLQKSTAFQRQGETLVSISVVDAGFMPLQGAFAAASPEIVHLNDDPHLYLSSFHGYPASAQELNTWFQQPLADRPVGLAASLKEILVSFVTWLTLHGVAWAQINAVNENAGQNLFPRILSIGGEKPTSSTLVLAERNGMAALSRPPGEDAPTMDLNRISEIFSNAFNLYIRPYGQSEQAAGRLQELLHQWDQDGRPPADRLQFRANPEGHPIQLREGEFLLKRPWTTLIARYS